MTVNYFTFPGITTESELQRMLRHVANAADVTVEQLQGRNRTADITLARHIFCWYAIKNGHRLTEVAKIINRHRTSVMHAEKVISGFIEIGNKQTLRIINKLTNK